MSVILSRWNVGAFHQQGQGREDLQEMHHSQDAQQSHRPDHSWYGSTSMQAGAEPVTAPRTVCVVLEESQGQQLNWTISLHHLS